MTEEIVPSYCADDGAALDVDEDGLAVRATCPDCGERWYGIGISSLLWRLPPTVREHADTALRWWFDRPQVTPILTIVRALVLVLPLAALADHLTGTVSLVLWVGVLVGWVLGAGVGRRLDAAEEQAGKVLSWHDLVITGVGVAALHAAGVTVSVPEVTVPSLPTLSLSIGSLLAVAEGGVLLVLGFAAFHVASQVGIRAHERLHWLAFRAIGVPARIEYHQVSAAGISLGIWGGETIPRPASWTGREWEHLVTGLAPVLLWVPFAIAVTLAPSGLVGEPIGLVDAVVYGVYAAWFFSGLPSGGDLGVIGTSRYRSYTQARQAPGHRAAEGVPG